MRRDSVAGRPTLLIGRVLCLCLASLCAVSCGSSIGGATRTPVRLSRPCSIVAFGDSITWGSYASIDIVPAYLGVTPVSAHVVGTHDTSYPGDLARLVRSSVCDYGIPGEMAQQGRPRFRDLLRRYRPRLIVLLEGVNDLPSGRTDEEIIGDLAAMRRDAIRRKVTLLVATLTPTYYKSSDFHYYLNVRVANLSAAIRTWARHERQPLADLGRAFASDRRGWRLFADGLHPNDAGYRVLAKTVAATIRRYHLPR